MSYSEFFAQAGLPEPFDYQCLMATGAWPDLLDVPTGMGKTAGVALAWAWKRGWRKGGRTCAADAETPRRLVWCLPMRTLVEQTEQNVCAWLNRLGILGGPGTERISVHLLMGGEGDSGWASYPEEDVVLIGTQDMLLSRALMRGYGMSRYQWPAHFALLHNDSFWVFDEVQLMGAGVATSAQLEALRRSFPLAKASRSLWVSATLNPKWLDTVDLRPHLIGMRTLSIGSKDRQQARRRLRAVKKVQRSELTLGKGAETREGSKAYLDALCGTVLAAHEGGQTIVIVNQVGRAQGLFRLLQRRRAGKPDLLVHSRFRAAERAAQNELLRVGPAGDRIVVATQAIEAGVDISCEALVTELAPWSSMVQRFGRCNRYGEHDEARVIWVDIESSGEIALPYGSEELAAARETLIEITSASPEDLSRVEIPRAVTAVLRKKDLLDLFNTDPDLSGFDVDVGDYVRGSGQPSVRVFWRDFGVEPNLPEPQKKPAHAELCPVPVYLGRDLQKRGAWHWDSLGDTSGRGRWAKLDRAPRAGMTLLMRAADGCYEKTLGFNLSVKLPVESLDGREDESDFSADWRSLQSRPVALTEHLGHVADWAKALSQTLGHTKETESVARAALWHDVGKAHEVFQETMHRCGDAPAGMLAKSPCKGRHRRRYFRHELASALAWIEQHTGKADVDLVAYLIAAHHGRVRMSLRAMPDEEADPGVRRYARGIWERDALPALDFRGEHSQPVVMRLGIMEMGEGDQGRSWTERTAQLLEQHGPFELAWLETLVRLADWRASAEEQKERGAGAHRA